MHTESLPLAADGAGRERDEDALPTWVDRSAYPFEPRTFHTPHGRMRYIDAGSGPPLLLVHGTPSWSFEWRAVIRALRGRARCVAPDHLGFGLSDKPRDAPYAPRDHAERLLALVRALDLRDLTLVVHDFGGPIGLPVLLEDAFRVRSVVLINTWMWPHAHDPRIARASKLVSSWLGRQLYLRLNASPRWLLPASFEQRSRLGPAVHRQYLAPFAAPGSRTAPWVLGRELAASDGDYAELWSRRDALLSRPVTLLWGMGDPAFGPAYLQRFVDLLPDARVIRLEDAGHFPQEEAPEAVTHAIAAALR